MDSLHLLFAGLLFMMQHLIPSDAQEMDLPENIKDSNPLRVFFQGGQSGCVGQASVNLLEKSGAYADLVGVQDGVWFGGLFDDEETFLIRPMNAGEASSSKNHFGPEVSIGRRISDASDVDGDAAPVLIVKYCWGGSNLELQWNPSSSYNSWDRDTDDGTAEWLLSEGVVNLNSKNNLYGNFVYTARMAMEVLDKASIPYVKSGFFWIQGSADKLRTWEEYANDSTNFFDQLRIDLKEPNLPIVDALLGPHHNLMTAKTSASEAVGTAIVSTFGIASAKPDSCCTISASSACPDDTYVNFDVYEHYGYDPQTPDDFKPEGATDKVFHWFKDYPNNQHAEYDGMVLRGRMLANAYLREFSPSWASGGPLDEENDPAVLFPWPMCESKEAMAPENICWIDLRNETLEKPEDCPTGDDNILIKLIKMLMQWVMSILRPIFFFFT